MSKSLAGASGFFATAGILAGAFPPPAAAIDAPAYTAAAEQSRLEFVGVQAGADFKGVFHKFSVAFEFAPDALAASRLDVQIDMSSVDSMDKDRDKTMKGPDVFDVAHAPTAHYAATRFTKTAAGYAAVGALTLHGVTKDVPIDFQFNQGPGGATLKGSAKLKRLDFGVGQGDWKSTEWIGDAVNINFSLVLTPKA